MASNLLDSIYTLPINSRKAEILASVDNKQVTIITAETGAGKSTQIPQFLAEHGYKKVIVTQPRILAARNLSSRVRQEYSWRRGKDSTALVGYRTAHEQDDSPSNVILYCTDGLQLVRELTGNGTNEKQVLVLDEIHEWNENMEVLIAWAKKRCQDEPLFKLVLMSATIEAESLATYFGSDPPITVAGRSFSVVQKYAHDLIRELKQQLLTSTKNILVFLPGKSEIEQVSDILEDSGINAMIIPLHSQLEPESQQKAFESYANGKVVLATNIAQTSITIDDIDVVIDSGLERRTEVRSGVEGLFISEISQADCLQRAGRTGRTKEGLYILAKYNKMPCLPLIERPAYGIPEIMRKHIDRLVLRLANVGIDIENLEFFHAPSKKTIKLAKSTLATLGALQNGTVTAIGHKMERFPVESNYGRMLVEAQRYSVAVQAKLAIIIAIQEVGGIVKGGPRFSGWRQYTHQNRSDLVAQFDVFMALPRIDSEAYEELGIIAKNVDKAQEVNERLMRELVISNNKGSEQSLSAEEDDQLLKCIIAGQLHQLWVMNEEGEAIHLGSNQPREISSTTVVKRAVVFAGTPFDLEIATSMGLETLHLVNDITTVQLNWLEELAPEKFSVQTGKVYFDGILGSLATRLYIKFNGQIVETAGTQLLQNTRQNQKLFMTLYANWICQKIEKERQKLQATTLQNVPRVPLKWVQIKINQLAQGVVSLAELRKDDISELNKLITLEYWFEKDLINGVGSKRQAKEHKKQHKHRHHGWLSRRKKQR